MTSADATAKGAVAPRTDSVNPLQRAINELFDDFFPSQREPSVFLPTLDIEERDGDIRVSAELPGVEAKDVQVAIEGDRLTIQGEKKSEKESEHGESRCVERCYGSFRRSVALRAEVDADKAVAELKQGVLTIQLPKAPGAAKLRKIAISS